MMFAGDQDYYYHSFQPPPTQFSGMPIARACFVLLWKKAAVLSVGFASTTSPKPYPLFRKLYSNSVTRPV